MPLKSVVLTRRTLNNSGANDKYINSVTLSFTQGSATVIASADITGILAVGDAIYNGASEGRLFAKNITAISSDGLTITLSGNYLGDTHAVGQCWVIIVYMDEVTILTNIENEISFDFEAVTKDTSLGMTRVLGYKLDSKFYIPLQRTGTAPLIFNSLERFQNTDIKVEFYFGTATPEDDYTPAITGDYEPTLFSNSTAGMKFEFNNLLSMTYSFHYLELRQRIAINIKGAFNMQQALYNYFTYTT